MSSILTNNGAMIALQTLRTINSDLGGTQSAISTGKDIASAKDNASVWAISKVMESDVKGFKGIADSLALGESTLAVAAQASETVTDLLTDIKGKIVAAQESNVDREKIQTDISALRDQINSVIGAAQFNGLSLVEGTDDVNILSSLDRKSDGSVTASDITVRRQDLSTSAGSFGTGSTAIAANITSGDTAVTGDGTANQLELTLSGTATDNFDITINNTTLSIAFDTDAATTMANAAVAINALGLTGISASDEGSGTLALINTNSFESFDVTWDSNGANTVAVANNGDGAAGTTQGAAAGPGSDTLFKRAEEVVLNSAATVKDGDSYRISVNGNDYDYIAGKGENMEDVARGLKTAVDAGNEDDVSTQVSQNDDGDWVVSVDYSGAGSISLSDTGQEGGTASGGLFGLDNIDVTTDAGADAALSNIETLISTAIDAAANFGSAQGRVETQGTFISNLSDALKSGIGGMVDADMEETSAKLQALQVQQQLAVQSLSIANQAPQTILSLFR
ncbi:Flagellin [Aquimixticola soesokkakensis]|uniref:Flagellin n=1 Tax=Aquimixticola soesokkakensis TaxID=1519096 RepID=A0A1Y5RD14_9RHOB|nr:flagellin [Aquimixticola soesokkakensis]SLN13773.1 Flagellin [Aquimixticola soesokkakensis]